MTGKRRCTGTTSSGRPCAAWAVRGSQLPLCSAHGGAAAARPQSAAQPHDAPAFDGAAFYGPTFSAPELSGLAHLARAAALDEEIAAARVVLRRLLLYLRDHPDLDAATLARLAPLAFRGTLTVARLLRDQRALSGEAADGIAGAIGQALDELGSEWGVEL